jgi:hypothetical protein
MPFREELSFVAHCFKFRLKLINFQFLTYILEISEALNFRISLFTEIFYNVQGIHRVNLFSPKCDNKIISVQLSI